MGKVNLFTDQPGVCVVYSKGVHKQVGTAHYKNELYAKLAGGYVRLRSNGDTNHSAYRWEEIEDIDKYRIDGRGRFIYKG